MDLFNDCEECCREVKLEDTKYCNLCDMQLCKECYEEYEGYCEECYERLARGRTEEEIDLWRLFWALRL